MRAIRIFLDLVVIVSTTLLLGTIATAALNNVDYSTLINIFLQSMHISLLFGTVVNIVAQIKSKRTLGFIFTGVPLVFFIIAFIGSFASFRFPAVLLITFDFYLIYWFFYLLLVDLNKLEVPNTEKERQL